MAAEVEAVVTEAELAREFERHSAESARIAEEAADAQREAVADEVWRVPTQPDQPGYMEMRTLARQGGKTAAGLAVRAALVAKGWTIEDGAGMWLAVPPEATGG